MPRISRQELDEVELEIQEEREQEEAEARALAADELCGDWEEWQSRSEHGYDQDECLVCGEPALGYCRCDLLSIFADEASCGCEDEGY